MALTSASLERRNAAKGRARREQKFQSHVPESYLPAFRKKAARLAHHDHSVLVAQEKMMEEDKQQEGKNEISAED